LRSIADWPAAVVSTVIDFPFGGVP